MKKTGRGTSSQNFLLALSSVLLLLILLEVSARLYIVHFAGEEEFQAYASIAQLQDKYPVSMRVTTRHRYLGHYPTPNYRYRTNRHNSLGFRGDEISVPKPEGIFRIACLGGSTTYTTRVDDYRLSYPYQLGEYLKKRGYEHADVINGGAGAWSSWETLISFELRVIDLEPDLIIIYHGINDIHPRMVWPPEAYRGDNSGRRAPSSTHFFMPGILEQSSLFRIFLVRAGLIEPHTSLERTIDKHPETFYGSKFKHQKMAGTYPDGKFKEVSAKKMLMTNKPRYFRRNIENIIALAKDRGIETVLVTFAYSPHFKDNPRVATDEYVDAYAETREVLMEIAREKGVNLFDFAEAFPKDEKYYTDGLHVNEEGTDLKARLIGEYLIENNLVPSPN